jgi:Domain of unknown function (DUF5667)
MSEGQRLERLAERLRAVDPIAPSPGAKIRGWNLVLAAVEQSATVRSGAHPMRRLVLAAVVAGVFVVVGAVAASADSLPDSALYPLKGVVENVRGALAFSPPDRLAYHLELAQTRLTEAEAMIARHRLDLADKALNALNDQLDEAAIVVQAENASDPAAGVALEGRLQQAIAIHDNQLASLQGQVANPAAISAILKARDRAAQALQTAGTPSSSNGHGSPSPSPNGKGLGNGTSTTPHPTPKHS